jgi:hypothetical protein
MVYFHAFWTRPHLNADVAADEQEIELWDFEALTWLVGALEIRRHSEILLVTDTRGLSFVRKAGMEWLYNGGVSTALDSMPADINHQLFWAAGKIWAWRAVEPPCACFDTDLVLWQPLRPTAPALALHVEDNQWGWYRDAEAEFKRHGFDAPDWNWALHPVNTAVACFREPELPRLYADTAFQFMRDYSRSAPHARGGPYDPASVCCDPMIFAEQRLLPMCAAKLGQSIELLRNCTAPGGYLPGGPDVMHLWTAKMAYKICPDARVALTNFLIDHLLARHPECRETLAKWKLDRPQTVERPLAEEALAVAKSSPAGFKFSLLRNVSGVVWIDDPVSGVRRPGVDGAMVWSAEIIRPEAGAEFELVVAGQQGVSFQQRA